MKELGTLVRTWEDSEIGARGALATVVRVRGSVYRRPGARLLVMENGCRVGLISGGCLEGDVSEKARQVMSTGKPLLLTYDTTSSDDIVWGLGLGCRGVVQVLVEPLTRTGANPCAGAATGNPIDFLAYCLRRRQYGALATILHTEGVVATAVGSHLMLQGAGVTAPSIVERNLADRLRRDACAALQQRRSNHQRYELLGGCVEAFIEVVAPPPAVVIFGTGPDAEPVARLAAHTGWHVTVVNTRPTLAASHTFPGADEVIAARPEAIGEQVAIDADTVAIVMTHNYLHDLAALKVLLPSRARYIGMLGPRRRTTELLADLAEAGMTPTAAQLRRVHAPVGLDIGAETPTEIAVAIVAEIQSVLSGHGGGFLRDRKGPIHLEDDKPAQEGVA